MDCPPNSPNCNPIENVWAIMKAKAEALCTQTKKMKKNYFIYLLWDYKLSQLLFQEEDIKAWLFYVWALCCVIFFGNIFETPKSVILG